MVYLLLRVVVVVTVWDVVVDVVEVQVGTLRLMPIVNHIFFLQMKNHKYGHGHQFCGEWIENGGTKQIHFGAYAQIWGGITNTLRERSIGAIALNCFNENGSWYFMALKTDRDNNITAD
eukprot:8293112-Ditylum_brightwellii.AAC.1